MDEAKETEKLTADDLRLIKVVVNRYINHLKYSPAVYSCQCAATGCNSDEELKLKLEKIRDKSWYYE